MNILRNDGNGNQSYSETMINEINNITRQYNIPQKNQKNMAPKAPKKINKKTRTQSSSYNTEVD